MLNKQLLTVEFLNQASKSDAVCNSVLYEWRPTYPKTLLHVIHTLLTFCLSTMFSLCRLFLLGGAAIILTPISVPGG